MRHEDEFGVSFPPFLSKLSVLRLVTKRCTIFDAYFDWGRFSVYGIDLATGTHPDLATS